MKQNPHNDPGSMRESVLEWPELLKAGFDLGAKLPAKLRRAERIVACGMGGSAIGAGLAGDYLAGNLRVPYMVHRDYGMPAFVNDRTLAICVSRTGNTEETISAYQEARERKSRLLIVTTGGELGKRAKADKVPSVIYKSELPPRAATPQVFGLLLRVLGDLGYVPDQSDSLGQAVRHLKQVVGTAKETKRNLAVQTAERLRGRIPFIYSSGLLAEAGRRFKSQLAENAKQSASWETLPEQNHNGIVGLEHPERLRDDAVFVSLRSDFEPARIAFRYEFLQEALDERQLSRATLRGTGPNRLSHLVSAVFWGDLTSVELARLNGVDPTPVKVIDSLKDRLAEVPHED